MCFEFVFWQEQCNSTMCWVHSVGNKAIFLLILTYGSTSHLLGLFPFVVQNSVHDRGWHQVEFVSPVIGWCLYKWQLGDVDAYIMGARVKPRQEFWWWWYPFPCPCISLCMGSPGIGGGWYKWQWGDVDIMAGRNFGDGDTQAHGRLAVRRWGRGRVGPSPMGPAGLLWVLCSS